MKEVALRDPVTVSAFDPENIAEPVTRKDPDTEVTRPASTLNIVVLPVTTLKSEPTTESLIEKREPLLPETDSTVEPLPTNRATPRVPVDPLTVKLPDTPVVCSIAMCYINITSILFVYFTKQVRFLSPQ